MLTENWRESRQRECLLADMFDWLVETYTQMSQKSYLSPRMSLTSECLQGIIDFYEVVLSQHQRPLLLICIVLPFPYKFSFHLTGKASRQLCY